MEPTGDARPTEPWSVSTVPPEQLEAVWPDVARSLAEVQDLDLEALRASLADGRRILWVVHRGDAISSSVVLEFVRHSSERLGLRVVALAGERFWEWAETVQQLLVDLAELTGAETLEASARPGMARWLSRLGWRPQKVVVSYRVQHCP